MKKLVRYEVDLNNLPPLTSGQEAEVKALSEIQESQIDYSDIPPLDEAFWENAVRNPLKNSCPGRMAYQLEIEEIRHADLKPENV